MDKRVMSLQEFFFNRIFEGFLEKNLEEVK